MSDFAPSDVRGPAFATALAGFTAKTGIKVKTVFAGSTEIFQAYETSVLAKQEPDVLIVNLYDKALTWTDSGATLPVTDYVKQWGLDKSINPAALADWTDSQGRVQALPYTGFTWPVWYNTATLAKAGITTIPKTTDDLIAAAAKLRAVGIAPVAIGGSDWSGEKFLEQIIQTTTKPDDTKSLMAKGGYCADPDAMKGIDNFVKMRDAGVFIDDAQGLTADNMYASFLQGQAAIMPAGSWAFPQATADQIPNITLGGFPLPANSTFDKPVAYQGFTASGFWLTANGSKRLADWKSFVDYMYQPDVAATFVASAGDVPVVQIPNLDTTLASQPLLASALTKTPDTVDYGVFPDFFVPGAKTAALTNATASAFAPETSSSAICAALDSVYN
ncbi:ABC transporter substrate-binding protein [Subtercola boreus]|nr:ABC transporter substrate-binding protein [Subtercola boreus]